MSEVIRWGILGTGNIAKQFARGLSAIPDAQLAAVGSRSPSTADTFASEFNIPRRHASYEALAADPNVDIIYISTPHHLHCENTILCLEHRKAVLCEKPFAINAAEARRMIDAARSAKGFLMEAMWTRYLPAVVKVREWLAAKAVGEPRMVMADFGFRTEIAHESRLFDPSAGGGGLLDVGIYPLSFAAMVFGRSPNRIAGLADLGETGVDEQAGVVLGYDKGEIALMSFGIRTNTPHEAHILGTDGSIALAAPFWKTTGATLTVHGNVADKIDAPHLCNGYEYEALEAMRCLREGELESPVMSLDESLALMETMDRIRAQWGLKYPME